MRRFVIGLALAAATVAAESATAATLTFNTCGDGPSSPGTCSYSVSGGESARVSSGTDPNITYTFAAAGQPNTTDDPTKNAYVRAYRTNATGGTVGLGTVARSKINVFDGGLGIDGLDSSNETNPQHAIDNVGSDEFIVFKLPSNGMVNVSFKIGFLSGDSDISVWLGGTLGGPGDAFNLLGTSGFQWDQGQTLVSTYGYKTQTFLGVPVNTSQTMTVAGAAGRYLIIGAQHECTGTPCTSEHGEDHFKLMSVVANTSPSPPSSVPYPGSLAMVGAGCIAVAAIRQIRRR